MPYIGTASAAPPRWSVNAGHPCTGNYQGGVSAVRAHDDGTIDDCLGIATPNRKIAKYGKSLSNLETSRPWVGRLHAVQKSPPSLHTILMW